MSYARERETESNARCGTRVCHNFFDILTLDLFSLTKKKLRDIYIKESSS
jgi:hypothetical protein